MDLIGIIRRDEKPLAADDPAYGPIQPLSA